METDEISQIRKQLQEKANSSYAENSKRYLKSPYSFYGIRVPKLREIAKQYKNLELYDVYSLFDELWRSKNHEEMSLGIFILQSYRKKYDLETWNFLIQRVEKAQTWDHIDYIASSILGYILLNDISLNSEIKKMSESKNPWLRRAAIVSTFPLIKKGKIDLTFLLAEKLIYDENIYVQKGAGWMLREAGKKERLATKDFILQHLDMKTSAFSYATEKMKELRKIKKEKEGNKEIGEKNLMSHI